mgnify:CR=1 FL=1
MKNAKNFGIRYLYIDYFIKNQLYIRGLKNKQMDKLYMVGFLGPPKIWMDYFLNRT